MRELRSMMPDSRSCGSESSPGREVGTSASGGQWQLGQFECWAWLAAALRLCPGRKHVSRAAAGPTPLAHFFNWHLSTKISVFLFFLFSSSDSSWASSHGVAASISDAYVAFGTLVSMDAQRRKRSVVNHCCQFLQSGGCFIFRDLHSCAWEHWCCRWC